MHVHFHVLTSTILLVNGPRLLNCEIKGDKAIYEKFLFQNKYIVINIYNANLLQFWTSYNNDCGVKFHTANLG